MKERVNNDKLKFERMGINLQALKSEMSVLSKKLELVDPS